MTKQIKLANPRGFCAGVDRAIDIVNKALEIYGAPVYVKHEVVHNKVVVEDLRARGAIFIEEIGEIPDDSLVIFSAHGVSSEVEESTKARNLNFFDATCPLVTKVHMEVKKHAKANKDIILIGHEGHPEVEGTMGRHINAENSSIYLVQDEVDATNIQVKNSKSLALVTQTTLSVDETMSIIEILKKRFPKIEIPKKDDICYATQNRQEAVKKILEFCDSLIVVGSQNSSNSQRLREIGVQYGIKSYLIDDINQININDLSGDKIIGITAGASAPEDTVASLVKFLLSKGARMSDKNLSFKSENITFSVPRELRTPNS